MNRRRGKRLDNWRLAPKNEGNECLLGTPCTFMYVCMCKYLPIAIKNKNLRKVAKGHALLHV